MEEGTSIVNTEKYIKLLQMKEEIDKGEKIVCKLLVKFHNGYEHREYININDEIKNVIKINQELEIKINDFIKEQGEYIEPLMGENPKKIMEDYNILKSKIENYSKIENSNKPYYINKYLELAAFLFGIGIGVLIAQYAIKFL